MKSHYLFSLLLILTLHSCTESTPLPTIPDPPTELPEITTEGLNTFGCLKDGELWLPEELHDLFNDNPDASYNEAGNFLSITSTQNENFNLLELIRFSSEIEETGYFELKSNPNNSSVRFYDSRNLNTANEYLLDSTYYNNYVEIFRLDKFSDIVSGTFEFQVVNQELQDTILFTEGRFDLEYTY